MLLNVVCLLLCAWAGMRGSRRVIRLTVIVSNVLMLPAAAFYGGMGLAHITIDNSHFGTTWQAQAWQPVLGTCAQWRPRLAHALGNATDALGAAEAAAASAAVLTAAEATRALASAQLGLFDELCACLIRVPLELVALMNPGLLAVFSGLSGSVAVAGILASTGGGKKGRRGGGASGAEQVAPYGVDARVSPEGARRGGGARGSEWKPPTSASAAGITAKSARESEPEPRRSSRTSNRASHAAQPWGGPTPSLVLPPKPKPTVGQL